jgi:peptidoglycan/xylan/chitin deacetylase (PgdA/CDA1 family)
VTARQLAGAALRSAGLRRRHLSRARTWVERRALAIAGPEHTPAGGRILCYHSVGTPQWGVNDVSPTRFAAQIEVLLRSGWVVVPARDIAEGRGGKRCIALTFDDGLLSVLRNAAPVLRAYRLPWTLFVVSGWADGEHAFGEDLLMDWRDVEAAAAAGASIGSHSVTHPRFTALDESQAMAELAQSGQAIRANLGIDVSEFAIPFGTSRAWSSTLSAMATEAGYGVVYAQAERRRSPGTVGRSFVTAEDGTFGFEATLAGRFDGWEEWA